MTSSPMTRCSIRARRIMREGPDWVISFAAPFFAAFPDLHHAIVYLLVDGDWAAMRYHGTGTLTHDYGGVKAAGQKLDYYGTVIFELANGRIAEVWGHSDLADWIAAQ